MESLDNKIVQLRIAFFQLGVKINHFDGYPSIDNLKSLTDEWLEFNEKFGELVDCVLPNQKR